MKSNSPMKSKCYIFFETLSTKLKIDIVDQLKEKSFTVNELSKQLKQERSKVSHALLSLKECGFVNAKKDGKKRIYSLNKETILPLLKLIEKHVKKYCKICNK